MYLFYSSNNLKPKEISDSKYFLNLSEEDIFTKINHNDFYFEVKKINFFIGSNNSGKSRFLRTLLKLNNNSDSFQILEEPIKIDDYFKNLTEGNWINSFRRIRQNRAISEALEYNETFENFYQLINKKQLTVSNLIDKNSIFTDFFSIYKNIYNSIENHPRLSNNEDFQILLEELNNVQKIQKATDYYIKNKINDKIYIPILRSLKKSRELNIETFDSTIKDLYNFENEKIFTGLKFFDNVRDIRNSVKNERIGFEKFEKFLSKHFFSNKDVEIIANLKDEKVTIYIDGEERKIHDIGDGIQQIILLMFPIFTIDKNSIIFIEEPETHLHPGLQRIFIETLLNDEFLKTKNLIYFFTTHSNHFLDLSLQTDEISIFQFNKESQENFRIINAQPNKEILDLLGVNNSSVFLANCSIWVEGPTDRKYISKFLKLYCEKKSKYLRENIDFAFLEYGGNLIAHYLFEADFDSNSVDLVKEKIYSFAISNKIYLLADNDNVDKRSKKGKRRKEFEDLSNEVNFKYQNTIYKEIENLLPSLVLVDFMKTLVHESEVEKIEQMKFKRTDYIKIGLGEFITKILDENNIFCSRKIKSSTAETLSTQYKHKLCDLVINGDYTYEDLIFENKQLEEIIKNLYNFIKPK